jgi:hypothetical protein
MLLRETLIVWFINIGVVMWNVGLTLRAIQLYLKHRYGVVSASQKSNTQSPTHKTSFSEASARASISTTDTRSSGPRPHQGHRQSQSHEGGKEKRGLEERLDTFLLTKGHLTEVYIYRALWISFAAVLTYVILAQVREYGECIFLGKFSPSRY